MTRREQNAAFAECNRLIEMYERLHMKSKANGRTDHANEMLTAIEVVSFTTISIVAAILGAERDN